MVVSMLPMNVFGDTVTIGGGGTTSFVASTVGSGLKQFTNPGRGLPERMVNVWKPAIYLTRWAHAVDTNNVVSELRLKMVVNNGQWAQHDGTAWLEWSDAKDYNKNAGDRGLSSYQGGTGSNPDAVFDPDNPTNPNHVESMSIRRAGQVLSATGVTTTTSAAHPLVGQVAEARPVNLTYEFIVLYDNEAELVIRSNTHDLKAAGNDPAFRYAYMPNTLYHTGESITITSARGGQELLTPPGGVVTVQNRTLNVSVSNPTSSETFLYFDRLNISEALRFDFSNGRPADGIYPIVTLYAPSNYKWVSPVAGFTWQIGGNPAIGYGGRSGSITRNPSARGEYRYTTRFGGQYVELDGGAHYERWHDDKYLTIHLPLGVNNPGVAERISLEGIGLVADNRADYADVNVRYAVDWVDAGENIVASSLAATYGGRPGGNWRTGADNSVAGGTGTQRPGPPLFNYRDHLWNSFNAGTRGWTELSYGLRPGTEPTDIRSGDQVPVEYVNWSATVSGGYSGDLKDNTGTVHSWRTDALNGTWTQWIRLAEDAVGAWGGTLGIDATFHMPEHGGAVILGAEVLFPENYYTGLQQTGANDWESSKYAPANNELGSWNYHDVRGVLCTPNYLEIKPGLMGYNERSVTRFVDVRFAIATEPGYEDKYGPEVEVTVTGNSTTNLYDDNVVVAAYVHDPITVDMDVADVEVSGINMYNVAVREIEPIVIRETDYGMLRKGDELWVYVTGARANEVEFTADLVPEVNTEDSGLKLTRGSVLRHRWSNSWVNGIRYTIEERSHERGSRVASDVGEVIITGGLITGPVYPGVRYEVVVSGTAVGANNYTVHENRRESSTLTSYDWSRVNSWRLFDSSPYSVDAFEFFEEEIPDAPPEPEPEPQPTVSQSLTLNEFSPEINGVKPFVMVQVDANTSVGMVSPRVIAEFFGGSATWDAGSGVATINGVHVDGSAVEVTLQAGATSGTVNGQSYDIATYSQSATPGLVSVYTSDAGNFYVPMRFMTNAFGYTIDWNPLTATATIRH